MSEVRRITTEFVDTEDRLRLTCQLAPGGVAVLWVTQRLFTRVLPHLLEWLQGQTPGLAGREPPRSHGAAAADAARAEVLQGFAQQAARAGQGREPPVPAQSASQIWLVHAVDLTPRGPDVVLTFRPQVRDAAAAALVMPAQALRQWLGIVCDQYQRAGWRLDAWPEWLVRGKPEDVAPPPVSAVH